MRDAPIIETLLDTDFYKFTMARHVWTAHGDVPVRYALRCRTKDARLAELVEADALAEQLEHVLELRFHDDELAYLGSNPTFPMDAAFLEERLRRLRLADIGFGKDEDGLYVDVNGSWGDGILWETFVLSIVNELYARGLARERGMKPDDL